MTWEDAAYKARYLLTLFAQSLPTEGPRCQLLIAKALEDFAQLSCHKDAIEVSPETA